MSHAAVMLLCVPCVALLYFLLNIEQNDAVSDTTGDATKNNS